MFDEMLKALPAPLLGGAILYGLLSALWLQPLVERRMATKIYIPQCEASSAKAHAEQQQQTRSETRRRKLLVEQLARSPLGQMPFAKEAIEIAEAEIERSIPKIPSLRTIDHTSRCTCAVTMAFDAIKYPMLFHVMSARTYAPPQLETMSAAVDGFFNAGACRMDKR